MNVWLATLVLALAAFQACECSPYYKAHISEFHDLDLVGSKRYHLVFRGTAGIEKSMYAAYKDWHCNGQAEAACKTTNWKAGACTSHYRNNEAIERFRDVRWVRVVYIKDGIMAKTVYFDGRGLKGKMSWFNKARYWRSRYQDMKKSPSNIFSIEGHGGAHHNRRFFMQRSYGGCDNDYGWGVVLDGPKRPCQWEKQPGVKWPIIMFAPGSNFVNWKDPSVERADYMAIFFQYEHGKAPGLSEEQLRAPVRIPEYFDMDYNGQRKYRLAFRATANINRSAYWAYTHSCNWHYEPACRSVNWAADCRSHYRNNQAMAEFNRAIEVLVIVYQNGRTVQRFRFNARNQNYLSWFSKCNYIRSWYHDIQNSHTNIFSIQGHGGDHSRRFYINKSYGGCDHDYGWLVAIDGARRCDWEKDDEPHPIIKYAPGNTVINWKDPTVRKADGFAVFFRMP